MTQPVPVAALYAPIQVVLREEAGGTVAFESDRPTTTVEQFGNPDINRVPRNMDAQHRTTLATAAD